MISPDTQTTADKKRSIFIKMPAGTAGINRVYLLVKRVSDFLLSLIGICLTFLPMCIVAISIRIESPGAAIYTQMRIGKNGKPFRIYKFRSMYENADEMIADFTPEQKEEWEANCKLNDDPRITKIGKFLRKSSLDELPQLLNILKGELSIVGPRPVTAEEVERYGNERDLFLSVTPGLTGYWQAYARSTCTYEQRIQMELHYAKNANLWWDIKIIFATVGAVLRGHGAK